MSHVDNNVWSRNHKTSLLHNLLRSFFNVPRFTGQSQACISHPLEEFRVHVDGDDDDQLRLALVVNRCFATEDRTRDQVVATQGGRVAEESTLRSELHPDNAQTPSYDEALLATDRKLNAAFPRLKCLQTMR